MAISQIDTVATIAAILLVAIPLYAWTVRGRGYATFGFVILAIALPGALVMHGRLVTWLPAPWATVAHGLFLWGLVAGGAHMAGLVRARLRSPIFRWMLSVPGMTFVALGTLCGVWLLVLLPLRTVLAAMGWTSALEVVRWLDAVPFLVAAAGLANSLFHRVETVRVTFDAREPATLTRLPVERFRRRAPAPLARRPLRIVQIADPHLGPWQPVDQLRRRLERLVDQRPDLVLLTGDFLTMEGAGTPGALARALDPLERLAGRTFAVFGNHDHEAPDEVRRGLAANGVRLLVDDATVVDTPTGPVQIVGADYVGRGRREHLAALLDRHPRLDGHLRLLLLHDPSAFRHAPAGDVDLALSGHTHGGQLGLVSFGFDWTVLSRTQWPDHGFFGLGTNRLYVHRGTGFYGFPLRIGVPGEASVMELVFD